MVSDIVAVPGRDRRGSQVCDLDGQSREVLGCLVGGGVAGAGSLSRGGDCVDAAGDGGGAGGGLAEVAGHVRRRVGLFLHGRGDGQLVAVDLLDDLGDPGDRTDGGVGVGLDGLDPVRDVLGGPRGLLGKVLDLVGDYGEAAPCLAGPGCLDGRVEREQVGLLRDRRDELDDVADLGTGPAELVHRLVGVCGLCHGGVRDPGRVGGGVRDLVDAGGHLLGRGGDAPDAAGHLLGGEAG